MGMKMRPVSIGRANECLNLASTEPISQRTLEIELGVSGERARELMRQMEDWGFLSPNETGLKSTNLGRQFLDLVRQRNWYGLHTLMMEVSEAHRIVFDTLTGNGPTTKEEFVKLLKVQLSEVVVDVVLDWEERLGVVQRNMFTGRVYVSGKDTKSLLSVLREAYTSLKTGYGYRLRNDFVEIPKLRETVCERLCLTRKSFDRELRKVYLERRSEIMLAGAPFTSQAKKCHKRIRTLTVLDVGACLVTEATSEESLCGLEIDGRVYFYFAWFSEDS